MREIVCIPLKGVDPKGVYVFSIKTNNMITLSKESHLIGDVNLFMTNRTPL